MKLATIFTLLSLASAPTKVLFNYYLPLDVYREENYEVSNVNDFYDQETSLYIYSGTITNKGEGYIKINSFRLKSGENDTNYWGNISTFSKDQEEYIRPQESFDYKLIFENEIPDYYIFMEGVSTFDNVEYTIEQPVFDEESSYEDYYVYKYKITSSEADKSKYNYSIFVDYELNGEKHTVVKFADTGTHEFTMGFDEQIDTSKLIIEKATFIRGTQKMSSDVLEILSNILMVLFVFGTAQTILNKIRLFLIISLFVSSVIFGFVFLLKTIKKTKQKNKK